MSQNQKSTIEETAQLLCVSITNEREKKISQSFEELLTYFKVMNSVSTSDESAGSAESAHDGAHGNGVLRDDVAKSYENTQALIERSEEHEAEYIVIPNIL